MNPPKIFISATSGDLSSARQIAKEALLTINCHPVEQTNFEPDWRSVTDMLRGKIGDCQALIHLVGFRYGAEPDPTSLPGGTPRRSYTQMEYHLARELGLRVYTFLLPETYPFDLPAKADTPEQTQLQAAHRTLIQSSPHLYEKPANGLDLRTRIIALQEQVISLVQEQQSIVKEVTNLATTLTTGQKQLAAQLSVVTAKIEQQAQKIKLPRLAQCRKDMLAKVRYDWIEGVLLPSVNESNRFNIGQELVPSAVVTDHRFPDREFGPEDDIAKLFDDSNSRLLILGNPGGGKTMLLLRLAERLLERAEKDPKAPIPVVLNLSSWWRDRLPLDQWMIREGSSAYQIPIAVMTRWVRDEAITPLLDGLDEVGLGPAAREAWVERTNRDPNPVKQVHDESIEGAATREARAACLEAINRYCQPNKNDPDSRTSVGIAVCSRFSEYDELTDKLRLNGALLLQELSDCQVQSVMCQAHMKGVRDLVEHEPWMAKMARSPFLLNVMSVAYAGKSLTRKSTQAERQRHLMAEYVNYRLKESLDRRENNNTISAAEIRHLLYWLALGMTGSGQTVFHIESLQMNWLSKTWARCAYCITSRWVFGFCVFCVGSFFGSGVAFPILILLGDTHWTSVNEVLTKGGTLVSQFWAVPLSSIRIAWRFCSIFLFAGVMASTLELARSRQRGGSPRRWLMTIVCLIVVHGLIIGAVINQALQWFVFLGRNDSNLLLANVVTTVSGIGGLLFSGVAMLIAEGFLRRRRGHNIRIIYAVTGFVWWTLIVLLLVGKSSSSSPQLVGAVVLALAVGSAGAAIATLGALMDDQIQTTERITWQWKMVPSLSSAVIVMAIACMFHLAVWINEGSAPSEQTFLVWFGVALTVGASTGVLAGFERFQSIATRVRPNEGVIRSIRTSVVRALTFAMIGAIVGAVIAAIIRLTGGSDSSVVAMLFGSVLLSTAMFAVGALIGGLDVPVKHYVIRLLLPFSDQIAFRLPRTLEQVSKVLLIRKVGGGFIFAHRFLLEHFATTYVKLTAP